MEAVRHGSTDKLPGMVAAWPVPSVPRSRSRAVGPWWMSVLAALLLALVYTHGVSGESAAGHVHPGTSTVTLAAQEGTTTEQSHGVPGAHSHERDADHHKAPTPGHAAHECVSGQPEHGAALPAPCESALPVVRPPYPRAWTGTAPTAVPWTSLPFADSAVLRI